VRRLASVAVGAALLLAVAPVSGQAASVSFTEIEQEVMCTVCGTPLNLAPQDAPFAKRQRAFIHRLIAQGRSKQQIKDALVAQYGDRVLALPPEDGFDIAAYVVPLALGLLALGLLLFIVSRWRKPPGAEPVPAASISAADSRRLDDDLRRYD
jgi:cytochrome c-type biogenesis protein CcmH/NrfF